MSTNTDTVQSPGIGGPEDVLPGLPTITVTPSVAPALPPTGPVTQTATPIAVSNPNVRTGPTPATVSAPVSRAPVTRRTTTTPDGTTIAQDDVPPINTTNEAAQTAAAINSELRSSYDFRAEVFVNAVSIGAPYAMEVSKSNNFQPDRYYVVMLLGAMPTDYDEVYWSSGDQKQIELRCGYADSDPQTLIVGYIDDNEINWRTRTLTLRGRDLSTLLVDNKTAEKFSNKTASQVAELLAARRGLSAVVTQTTTLVGVYYEREHAKLNIEQSEHDLLKSLAELEGFDYWYDGNTLHFEVSKTETSNPFVIYYTPPAPEFIATGTFIELTTKRFETYAKDILVTVISFDPKTGRSITVTAKRSRIQTSGSKVTRNTTSRKTVVTPYVFRRIGLKKAQAQNLANKYCEQISKYERNITADVPYDPVVNIRTLLSLRGTGTDYDQAYFIDTIEYSVSFEQGSRMEITAKNSSPSIASVGQ